MGSNEASISFANLINARTLFHWKLCKALHTRGSSTSAKSFFVHHTQLLAAAAQVSDAKGIRKEVTEKKMRLLKDALKATGRG